MHTFQMSPNHSSCCASFKFHLNKTSLENAPGAGCFQREAHERRENVEERVRAARAKKHVPTSLSICTRAPVVMQDDVEGVQLPHQARRPVDWSCHESRLLVVDQFQKLRQPNNLVNAWESRCAVQSLAEGHVCMPFFTTQQVTTYLFGVVFLSHNSRTT